ncbi:efflux RND transporter permease subunit [Phenylobacterium immobile]|uniref:efflux RND transporter permease subunit n=1 Tax=Phenylobacterium immobile TaxID=21 RepID=UPI000B0F663B|nr:efflux RND transporter permease subunit [Phenylobacterium immobile]
MISQFFIGRPIFAWVIAIVIMLVGVLAIFNLPIAQYPNIALPQITVQATYPGASAKAAEDSVTQVIEQRMKGLDGLLYMSSSSSSSGSISVTLTFKSGTNPDIAQVQVQNKVQSAIALLPQEVQQQGVSVVKSQFNFMMFIALYTDDLTAKSADLGDYAASNVVDPISRVDGVGEAQLFGSAYAMRIWLDPAKLAAVSLTPSDITAAIRAQNTQVSAGKIGSAPATPGTEIVASINAQSRLQTEDQFRQIILKNTPGASIVRLGDVARVELGAESYVFSAKYNNKPAVPMGIKLAPGANALETNKAVLAKLDELQKSFPAGVKYAIPSDTTPFVKKSLEGVVHTLIEAVVLVFLVMYLFLQNWRATLIPTIAVPVVLLGTFGVLAATGYKINTLTMFAMVLAIGFLVDDAIVVVENVERIMREEGLSPVEATRKSMREITGALIAIALVLSAVFVPMAFFGGSQGVIYRQFSITLVSAMALSVIVALILTPALCATLLKPIDPAHDHAPRGPLARPLGWFNRNFDRASERYQGAVRKLLPRGLRTMAVYAAIVVVAGLLFVRLPTAFLPEEDQGSIINIIELPANATVERTQKFLDRMSDHLRSSEKEGIDSILTIAGFSFAGQAEGNGIAFAKMRPFEERSGNDLSAKAVAGRAMGFGLSQPDATAFAIVPPAVPELGQAQGFEMQLQDTGGVGHEALIAASQQLIGMAAKDPRLAGVRLNGLSDNAQLNLSVDLAKAGALGLSSADINATLVAAFGGSYVNDFIDRGRVKKVLIQADASNRMQAEDLDRWFVRNKDGEMTPLSSFATAAWTKGPPALGRYNGVPALNIQGSAAPGKSSGEAMKAMEELVGKLPSGIGFEWTGLSLQERAAGAQAPMLYALSIVVVFLLLAALYESWTIPLSVILVIPLGVVGALLATSARGLSNDIYFQVGLLTTMGLAAKNAILIVEFAVDRMKSGMEMIEATIEAVRIRLRPIIMTSLAFVFGVLPLAISTGAGSGSQHSIGTGVIGGMLTATFLGIFFVPVFFVVVRKLFHRREHPAPTTSTEAQA